MRIKRSLDFEFKDLIIIVNKDISIINKANLISNTTPLSFDDNHQLPKVGKLTTTISIHYGISKYYFEIILCLGTIYI